MRICKFCEKEIPKGKLDNWKYARRVFCKQECYTEYKKTIRHSDEYKKKMSDKLKGRKITWIDKLKGKKHTEQSKQKISKARIGIKFTKEHKKKLSEAKLRNPTQMFGEKNPLWKGGISTDPYPIDWTETLRRSIRERDKYICQLCSKPQGDIAHAVHHIDYNKQNCNPNNLITLCHSCHLKTNTNRGYWTNYFKK